MYKGQSIQHKVTNEELPPVSFNFIAGVARVRSWWIHVKERDHLEDVEADMIILKLIFKKSDAVWTEVSWHRTGTGGGFL
jgi:hypothetical protein